MTETMSAADYRALVDKPKRNKYNNVRVAIDGYSFDSQAEARRYVWLKDEVARGRISCLRVHPWFELQPAFRDRAGKRHRSIRYQGDFAYIRLGRTVVEDVKGRRTGEFNLKEKLFLFKFPDIQFDVIPAKIA